MKHKYLLLILIFILAIICFNCKKQGTSNGFDDSFLLMNGNSITFGNWTFNPNESKSPVHIYPSPNGSNSRTWAKSYDTGTLGMVYSIKNKENSKMNLVYRTIYSDGNETKEVISNDNDYSSSVLILNSENQPLIFTMNSNKSIQEIYCFHKIAENQWEKDFIIKYHTLHTQYEYFKAVKRFDFAVDKNSNIHFASPHGPKGNYLNSGQIRYATEVKGGWKIKTIYRQSEPVTRYITQDITDLSILISNMSGEVRLHYSAIKFIGKDKFNYSYNILYGIIDMI